MFRIISLVAALATSVFLMAEDETPADSTLIKQLDELTVTGNSARQRFLSRV